MAINKETYQQLISELSERKVTLVAVSKTKSVEDILELYQCGQIDFGENYVQELVSKAEQLPKDIRWHYIGHLQNNKVKYIAPFVHLVHGVDSLKLLNEMNKQAIKNSRVMNCLLQEHIAEEETKFGLNEEELGNIITYQSDNVNVCGMMGMASFTEDMEKVRKEFQNLKGIFERNKIEYSQLTTLSMGMSADYKIAIEEGSNMVRIGSLLFGERS
jgi:pyridoxal phosphate enzyme (YggS family)